MTAAAQAWRCWTVAAGPERIVEALLSPERLPRLEPGWQSFTIEALDATRWQARFFVRGQPARMAVFLRRTEQRAKVVLDQRGFAGAHRGELELWWSRVPSGGRLQACARWQSPGQLAQEAAGAGASPVSGQRAGIYRRYAAQTVRRLLSGVERSLAIAVLRERRLQTRIEDSAGSVCPRCLGTLPGAGDTGAIVRACTWAEHAVLEQWILGESLDRKRVEECPREGRGGEFGHSSGKRLGAGGASSSASKAMLPKVTPNATPMTDKVTKG